MPDGVDPFHALVLCSCVEEHWARFVDHLRTMYGEQEAEANAVLLDLYQARGEEPPAELREEV